LATKVVIFYGIEEVVDRCSLTVVRIADGPALKFLRDSCIQQWLLIPGQRSTDNGQRSPATFPCTLLSIFSPTGIYLPYSPGAELVRFVHMSISRSIYWLFQLIGWGCFAAINIFFAFLFERMADEPLRSNTIIRMTVFVLLGLLSTHIMRAVIRRFNVVRKPLDRQFAYFFFLSILFSLIPGALFALVIFYGNLLDDGEAFLANKPTLLVLHKTFFFFINIIIWNLVYFIYHFVSLSRRNEQNLWQLADLIKEIELNNYKLQQEQK
jgi:hypothetical protein